MKSVTLILLVGLVAAGPAMAQLSTGTILPPWGDRASDSVRPGDPAHIPADRHLAAESRARVAMLAFARCVTSRSRLGVQRALALPPLQAASKRALSRLAAPECLDGGQLSLPYPLLRGALFNALYRTDFSSPPSIMLGGAPLSFSADISGEAGVEQDQYVALHRFGDCVVRSYPTASRSLVLAPTAGLQEAAALTELGPSMASCVAPDNTLHFSRSVLWALFSEVLYRETTAAGSAPPRS